MFANTQMFRNNDREDEGEGPGDEGPSRPVHDIHMNAGQADASGDDDRLLRMMEMNQSMATGRSSSLLPSSSGGLVDNQNIDGTLVFENMPLGPDRMEVENEDEVFQKMDPLDPDRMEVENEDKGFDPGEYSP
jgi:hypothetical protein